MVYLLESPAPDESPDERNLDIIFTDTEALGRIRFETFLADSRRLERAATEFEDAAANESALMRAFIAREHDQLLRTFNPKVTRLRKRTKIMVHRQAFDGMRADDDEPK